MKLATRAYSFAHILDAAPKGVKILSLDCFDTLLWRNCNQPVDVFAELSFAGSGMETRGWGENRARRIALVDGERGEVTIEEIYAAIMPAASQAERDAAIAAEIDAEARHCYGFQPTVDLMKAAKAQGLSIIIVSDTYFSKDQLRGLIARAAGDDVAAMIDRIFCSSEYGMSKNGGLFMPVLAELGASPATILHCGDNPTADVEAAEKLGINCCHLVQFDEESEQRLRLEATMASMVNPQTRVSIPAHQPHRPQVALRKDDAPAARLGHDVLGPMLHAFAGWIREEAHARAAETGKPTKLLFLLRDGYLPAQMFLAAHPDMAEQVKMVEISRLTAALAGMTDKAAIDAYVLPDLANGHLAVIARQLHFTREEAEPVIEMGKAEFAQHIAQPEVIERVTKRARAFSEKLAAHLGLHGIEEGDSVMLVDLGYNGTVQNLVEAVLRARMKLDVCGRYLLLRESFQSGLDKAGFIDQRHNDLKLLHALSDSISIVEQLCTLAQGSVLDYRKDGSPVRESGSIKATQSKVRDEVQAACLAFARDADKGPVFAPASDTGEARRNMATASLARLLFLPVDSEIDVLGDFAHDVNFGTANTIDMLDIEAAAKGLRRRGIFYVKNAMRMYLPAEMHQHGLPINLSFFAARRFGLDFRKTDFDVGAIQLPVILMDAHGEHVAIDVDALPTIEGYYRALIPVGAAQFTVGVQLGRIADFVQIEETSFHPVEEYLATVENEATLPAPYVADGLEELGGGLMRCAEGETAFLLVPPPAGPVDEAMLLSVVFRPVVRREGKVEAARAAA